MRTVCRGMTVFLWLFVAVVHGALFVRMRYVLPLLLFALCAPVLFVIYAASRREGQNRAIESYFRVTSGTVGWRPVVCVDRALLGLMTEEEIRNMDVCLCPDCRGRV